MISDITNPFFTDLVRGVEDAAHPAGLSLILCNTDENPEKERHYLEVLLAQRVAGIALVPTGSNEDLHAHIQDLGIPLVYVDRPGPVPGIDRVTSTNRAGAHEAVTHLVGHAYHSIAVVTGPEGIQSTEERTLGYLDAMKEAGMSPHVVRADLRELGGFEAATSLLAQRRPQAILATNNLMAFGAVRAARAAGLGIPDGVAIIGVDDMMAAQLLEPPLTVVAQQSYELGRESARLLNVRAAHPSMRARQVELPTSLIVRRSCGPHVED